MIDVTELRTLPLDPVVENELDRFEDGVARYLAGEIDDDAFRVFRLNQGIYGQRQGGHNQMLRTKIPHGRVEPDQLEMFAYIADEYSRGWGHLTTRQNVQFHFVQLERVTEALRLLAAVGVTSAARPAATPCATCAAAISRARAPTRSSTSRRGHRPPPTCSSATRSRNASPASSRSTSRVARPTAARRCSTTSVSSR